MSTAATDIPAQLGKPLRVYTSNRYAKSILVAFPIVLVGLIIGIASATARDGGPIGVVIGLVIIGGGIWAGYSQTSGNGWKLTLCEGGISSRDNRRIGGVNRNESKDIAWDDIIGVRSSITTFVRGMMRETFEFYILRLKDRSTFDLTSALKGIRQLGEKVQDEVYKRVSPQITEKFNAGQEVDFEGLQIQPNVGIKVVTRVYTQEADWDSLRVNADGQRVRDRLIPWAEVADVSLHQGVVTIRRADNNTQQIEVSEIANIPILWSILEQVLGRQRVR